MEGEFSNAGIWSIMPPLVAIALALVTRQVVFSLLIGVISGSIIYSAVSGLGIIGVFSVTVETMIENIADTGNASIIIFVVLLGALVALLIRAGGSNAYGIWASRNIQSKQSACLFTSLLAFLIFIDDYFNCLTVGTIMRPVTDRYRVSREKLCFLIDATAAPVCIIAPISSWSAAVISYIPATIGISGMQAFISSIPMNLYALLTVFMVIWFSVRKNSDYGPMADAEQRTEETGGLGINAEFSAESGDDLESIAVSGKGRIFDMIIPLALLVLFSVAAMMWSGGYWSGESKGLLDAFGDTNAGFALSLGGFGALAAAFFLYVPRRLISLKDFFITVSTGIKSMVPAIIILTLAWTISSICSGLLHTGSYFADLVESSSMPIAMIPAILFVFAFALSFATNSWGAFGILIPIGFTICSAVAPHLSIITLSAILAGSVWGDHCSPISDTTILSSIGARCNQIDHVVTQMPYAVTAGIISFIGYIVSGFTSAMGYATNVAIMLLVTFPLLIAALLILPKIRRKPYLIDRQ